ncbi:InlB B-repeat-containing protein, partial [Anaerotignum sp.]|uniref:InlB B-repeat-containing protein n=1 Tax=Anaerotignum sp. TaxID=2039241 RepID=UPI00289C4A4E
MNKNKLFRRILTMALSVAMILGMLPVTALAAGETFYADISQGNVNVSNGEIAYYDSEGSQTEAYSSGDSIIITGTTAEHTITVDGVDANITLDGVDIQLTEENKCAFALENDAAVNLTLEDDTTNTLTSGNNCAGLQVPDGTTINIDGGGTLKANGGKYSAGIGGNSNIGGGNVTIQGGIITANGNWGGAGIGGGMGTAGGTLTITGGTIDAGDIGQGANGDNTNDYCYISGGSVYEEQAVYIHSHTQVSESYDTPVYMTTVTLGGIDKKTAVDSLSVTYNSSSYSYGTDSMYTDESGKLYLWLPDGATVTGAEVGETSYSGSVTTTDDYTTAVGTLTASGGSDEEAPTVESVTPNGTDVAASGDVVITFSEAMDTNTAGTVSLDNGVDTLNTGEWSGENKVYKVSYSQLANDTEYTITISGFKDVAGNKMTEDTHTFTTKASGGSSIWDGTTDKSWYNDTDKEFTITTAKQLAGLAELVNDGKDFSGKTVKLGEDIVLNDVSDADNWDENTKDLNSWAPIGNDNAYFSGIFDGNGHTVSGIYIQVDKYGEGLFGSIKNGTVQNLGVTKSYICGKARIGGIVAYCDGGTISKCYNEGTVRSTSQNMAGSEVGGIAGCINSLNNKAKVENCYNTGNVIGSHGCIGGIVGNSINNSSVVNCYNTGTLNYGSNTSFIGCIVGFNDVTVTDCYYDSTTCGYNDNTDGVQGKSTKNMQTATPFKNWSTDVWIFEANKYPQLIKPESSGESGDETYTAKVSPNSNTFAEALAGYSDQAAQEFTITNTGTGTITGLSATLSAESSFVISTALSSESIAPGGTATVSVRPKTGLSANTYTDTLAITGDNAVSLMASLSFEVTSSGSSIWDGTKDTSWYSDTGSTFTITTAEQLAGFAELVNGGKDFSGKTVKLGADIALNDVSNVSKWETTAPKNTWTPIGVQNKVFKGIFNGEGHTVSGIYINSGEDYQSLFGWILKAEIINLGVMDSYINGNMFVAGVVSHSDSSTVKNVCVTNSYINSSYYFAAGIVANNASASGTVQNCYNAGIVKGYSGTAAGVVFYNSGTVQNCYYDKETSGVDVGISGGDVEGQAVGKSIDWMKNATNTSGIESDDSTFNEWDTSIWVFESDKYPYFKQIETGADAVDAAKTAAAGATYETIKQADAADEEAVKVAVEKIAKEAVKDDTVTVTITDGSYTAPTAGTSADPDGTDGSYSFTVTVKKGNQSRTTDMITVTIKATVDENALTGKATITGDAVFGKTLTASLTDSNSTGTLSYQWIRGGEDISGATESTYTLTKDDVGAVITVKITSSDKKGTRTSDATSEIGKVDCEGTALAPILLERTDNSITLQPVEGYQYGISFMPPDAEQEQFISQDSNKFIDLRSGLEYKVYQWIKETDTHKASKKSEALTVTTKVMVTYNCNYEGAPECYSKLSASVGDKLAAPTTPIRAGYTFGGWYTDSNCKNPWNFKTDNVEHSMTFYAKWTEKSPETLEVIYVEGDTTSGKVPKGRSNYKSGDTVTVFGNKGNLSKSGASFLGWSHGTTTYKEGDTFTINDNMVLTAVWTEETKECTVTFNSNYAGGGTYTTQTVTYGSLLTKPATPTRNGYSFIGWYKNANCTNPWSFEFDTVTENTTLYTKWAQGTYSVSGTVVDDITPPNKVDGATVKIMKGNIQFGDTVLTDSDGNFTVSGIPDGEYNIVITKNGQMITLHIKVNGSDFTYKGQIILPKANKNSKLNIIGSDTPNIVENGLDDLFQDSDIYDDTSKQT